MKVYIIAHASADSRGVTNRRPTVFGTAEEAEAEIGRLTDEAAADPELDWIEANDDSLSVCYKSDVLEAYEIVEVEID